MIDSTPPSDANKKKLLQKTKKIRTDSFTAISAHQFSQGDRIIAGVSRRRGNLISTCCSALRQPRSMRLPRLKRGLILFFLLFLDRGRLIPGVGF